MTKEQIEKLGLTYTDGMTDEQVFEALSKKQGELTAEKDKAVAEAKNNKTLVDKYSSEIASYKDKEKARLTDDEKKALEVQEMKDKIAQLEKEKSVSDKKAKYIKLGYSDEQAQKVALGEIEGNDVSDIHAEFLKAHDEELKKALMKKNPDPNGAGDPNKTYTREDFKAGKYSYEELCELQAKNPTLFEEITK